MKKFDYNILWVIIAVILTPLISLFIIKVYSNLTSESFAKLGQVGDIANLATSIFTGLAFLFLIKQIQLQSNELKAQREELEQSRIQTGYLVEEAKNQSEAMEIQISSTSLRERLDLLVLCNGVMHLSMQMPLPNGGFCGSYHRIELLFCKEAAEVFYCVCFILNIKSHKRPYVHGDTGQVGIADEIRGFDVSIMERVLASVQFDSKNRALIIEKGRLVFKEICEYFICTSRRYIKSDEGTGKDESNRQVMIMYKNDDFLKYVDSLKA